MCHMLSSSLEEWKPHLKDIVLVQWSLEDKKTQKPALWLIEGLQLTFKPTLSCYCNPAKWQQHWHWIVLWHLVDGLITICYLAWLSWEKKKKCQHLDLLDVQLLSTVTGLLQYCFFTGSKRRHYNNQGVRKVPERFSLPLSFVFHRLCYSDTTL